MRGASSDVHCSVPPVWRKRDLTLPPFATRRKPRLSVPAASKAVAPSLIEKPRRNTRVVPLVMANVPPEAYTLPSRSAGPLSHSVPPPVFTKRQWWS